MTVGTVAYAAPEQLMGESMDGRADEYALAATTYNLLTGSQLFPRMWWATWAVRVVVLAM